MAAVLLVFTGFGLWSNPCRHVLFVDYGQTLRVTFDTYKLTTYDKSTRPILLLVVHHPPFLLTPFKFVAAGAEMAPVQYSFKSSRIEIHAHFCDLWECDKKLKVKDEAAGKKVRCPGCSGIVAVPKPAEPEVDELEDFDDDFEVHKPKKKRKPDVDDDLDFGDDELDDLGDELPVRSKSSGKNSKKGKAKTRSKSGPSQGFLLEFYEGRLSQILAKIFWGIFCVTLLLAPFGKTMLGVYFITMIGLVWLRSFVILFWWARICAANTSVGFLAYIAFYMFPVIGLIYGALNNELCEKPNRMFMFSLGIVAMTFVVGIPVIVVGASVLVLS
ncbi:MAG: hypothetical protein JWN70_6767 [Planctomycetaceae bacterium]|nr:hypothetical protein [Planctomycetaceae bacterium]